MYVYAYVYVYILAKTVFKLMFGGGAFDDLFGDVCESPPNTKPETRNQKLETRN